MSILSRMDARRLNERVTFQRKNKTGQNSSTGEVTYAWQDYATAWAAVDAPGAYEKFADEQELGANDYKVWIRWRNDLTPDMRVIWNGLQLDIKGIPNNQKRARFMCVIAESGINAG